MTTRLGIIIRGSLRWQQTICFEGGSCHAVSTVVYAATQNTIMVFPKNWANVPSELGKCPIRIECQLSMCSCMGMVIVENGSWRNKGGIAWRMGGCRGQDIWRINMTEQRLCSHNGRHQGEGRCWDGIGHSITLTTAIPPCKSRFESPWSSRSSGVRSNVTIREHWGFSIPCLARSAISSSVRAMSRPC